MNHPASTDDPQLAATALIAEDEPLLAQALQAELGRAWPGLAIVAQAPDGDSAVELALQSQPQLLFLDIRMPGRSGLEAAQAIVEDWPAERPLPLIVFITAYDQYALQAFEASAVDYLLKPVQPARLAAACQRLRGLLVGQRPAAGALPGEQLLGQLRALLGVATPGSAPPLSVIQASSGSVVHMVPIEDVVYFEAADKYVRVLTAEREHLIRTSLRELLPQLDPERFWQVHRSIVIQAREIAQALRDEAGRVQLVLRRRPERISVSRIYAPRFKGM
ncbi:LytTR family DNA-binding domain-containing protein [Ideonella sp.]|uniref:LytR/AlgR family response regulator transcription factor n=1 Tax=Ideonella sp. TaxID=1929293 RepID=UPI002B484914|nr:LytTR family DNA-binding domain-containing protein [Ideonella sp.]HJV68573.1 LytTR family DNA-binding domain-containing protein [Ideonella sp.]